MKTLLCILLLSVPVFAQSAIEPTRIALTFSEDCDFNDALRDELQAQHAALVVSERVDFDIYITSGPIGQAEKTIGYACAVAIVTGGKRDAPIRVYLIMGPTMRETAQRAARRVNQHLSKGRK